MKIKVKGKGVEVEITYKSRWWGSEWHWRESFMILPFILKLFDKKFEVVKMIDVDDNEKTIN